ncbi:PAS domain-containing sensor histidine kinase [Selenihalanaerobacter shriftii]|uniref:histidine kinase n=1 Tax=Selenihalanaerobacter shriftii TaxID=142842 RepID=A0A1T4JJT8_9FIRM|nr:PAS domain-containing sensor histidine kinase [Selenihalanaerobacter shriftii]SJZ30426.1 PAS fold-containing protein [Selenihalanaerobacter shriftii]
MEDLLQRLVDQEVDFSKNWAGVLDSLHDLVVYKDINYRIIWANQTMLDKYDLSLDEIKGEYCYKALHNRDDICEGCIVEQAQETGKIEEGKRTNYQGEIFLQRIYPMRNNQDKVIGFFKIGLNITERKQLQEELKYSKLKNEFFANLSHEFKTPLNLIFSGLQMLNLHLNKNLKIDKDEKSDRYLNVIKQNSYRLLKLINNLVDINKIESDALELNLENHDVVDLIKKIVLSVESYAKEINRELKYDSELKEKIIACDFFNLERIILNLISNAIKFTEEDDEILVKTYETDDYVVIEVKDTGIGILEEKQEIIFKRFGQVDKSFTRNSEGSGIGLFIVKSLVEMHGGSIKVESELGKGSRFIVKLPNEKLPQGDNHQIEKHLIDKVNIEFSDIYS